MASRVVIGSNLLVLLTVGLTNRTYITAHRRLSGYDGIDMAGFPAINFAHLREERPDFRY